VIIKISLFGKIAEDILSLSDSKPTNSLEERGRREAGADYWFRWTLYFRNVKQRYKCFWDMRL